MCVFALATFDNIRVPSDNGLNTNEGVCRFYSRNSAFILDGDIGIKMTPILLLMKRLANTSGNGASAAFVVPENRILIILC